jgi:hypothetical protein
MTHGVFGFEWHAPIDDGQVTEDEDRQLRFSARGGFRVYRPLDDEPCLFRAFVELPGAPDEITVLPGSDMDPTLAFARRYGALTFRVGDAVPPPARVESVYDWMTHISWMKYLAALWDLLEQNDLDGLSEVVRWRGNRVALFSHLRPEGVNIRVANPPFGSAGCWPPSTYRAVPEELSAIIRPGDVAGAALWYLQEGLDGVLGRRPRYRIGWDLEAQRPIERIEPDTLADAMYVQLAQTVACRRKQQKCQGCGRWFELAPGVNRADRLSCSAACRQRSHRWRIARAQQRHAQGLSLRAIADEVGSDVATVKGWLLNQDRKD